MSRKNLVIRSTISQGEDKWSGPYINFSKWMPESTDVIVVEEKNISIRIWLDKDCIASPHDVDREQIKSYQNILVSQVYLDVQVNDVEEDLMMFIFNERDRPKNIHHGITPDDPDYDSLNKKYKNIGIAILHSSIKTYNRLISYARNIKGQYWLEEYYLDNSCMMESINNKFNSKAKFNDNSWFRWCPPGMDPITFYLEDDEIFIKEDDWPDIQKFVNEKRRPNLAFELLANAQHLFFREHRRSAVIEAVTALEVAISLFGSKPNVDTPELLKLSDRVDMSNLHNQIKHLGFSGSLRFLIPLLFSDEILPTKLLEKCQKAIDLRNNIVHNGQRNVNPDLARELISAIKKCCKIIVLHTL